MMTALNQFHFLRPEWLLLLLPVAGFGWYLLGRTLKRGDWQEHIDDHLRGYMLDQAPDNRSSAAAWVIILAWIIASLALAGPTWERKAVPVVSNPNALVILFDMSLSMGSEDVKPSRAVAAVRKATDILRARPDGVTAVIAYAGDAHTVVPFTDDTATIIHLLGSLSPQIMPKPGSRPDKALTLTGEMMLAAGIQSTQVLLLTDGIQSRDIERIRATLPAGADLSVIAIGTREGAPVPMGDQGYLKDGSGNIVLPRLDTAPLQQLYGTLGARWTGLSFDDSDWKGLIEDAAVASRQEEERTIVEWTDSGFWLVILILPVALFSFRRGVIFSVMLGLGLSLTPQQVDALEWNDLWQTADQQGQALIDDDPAAAAEKFNDPQWRASAHYRAGNYAAAAEDFALSDTATGDYNRGNALAQSGELDAAIDAYKSALSKQPDFPQAQKNLDLLEQLKEQQEQQQNSQDQNSDEQQENSDSQQGENSDSQQNEGSDSQNSDKQNSDSSSSDSQNGQNEQDQQPDSQQNSQNNSESQQDSAQQRQQDDQYADEQSQQQEESADNRQSAASEPDQSAEESEEAVQKTPRPSQSEPAEQSPEENMPADFDGMSREEQAAMEAILNQVPDNPGLLMQRKFLYQYRQSGDTNEEDVLW